MIKEYLFLSCQNFDLDDEIDWLLFQWSNG